MRIVFYDHNEEREKAGITPDDFEHEVTDEIHIVYEGIRDGDKWLAFYIEGSARSGAEDGWSIATHAQAQVGALYSDWVVIP